MSTHISMLIFDHSPTLELASLFLRPNMLPFFTPFSDGIVNANTIFFSILKGRL